MNELLIIAAVVFGWIFTDLLGTFTTKDSSPIMFNVGGAYICGIVVYARLSGFAF